MTLKQLHDRWHAYCAAKRLARLTRAAATDINVTEYDVTLYVAVCGTPVIPLADINGTATDKIAKWRTTYVKFINEKQQ